MESTISSPFAMTLEEVNQRYEQYRDKDPFPDIEPALLNSAHIQAYIAKTGMIFPYHPDSDNDKERVTSASLILTIGPEVLFWDKENNQQYKNDLPKDGEIVLRPNSITFLRPAERFSIPDYIAIRFNLRIKHVHRGLLLGTGPLLDPGFRGFPMIPVHNLTNNEYRVKVGEEFINVEFTRISKINDQPLITSDGNNYIFKYKKNRGKTLDFSFLRYIEKNVPTRKVKSSLSGTIDEANILVEKIQKRSTYTLIGAIVAVCALVASCISIALYAIDIIDRAQLSVQSYKKQEIDLKQLNDKYLELNKKLETIELSTEKSASKTKNNVNVK